MWSATYGQGDQGGDPASLHWSLNPCGMETRSGFHHKSMQCMLQSVPEGMQFFPEGMQFMFWSMQSKSDL